MKNERLFQMVNLLIKKKNMTALELSKLLQVSVRTIYRDLETLSLSGIPIYTTAGRNGGVSILEEYKLDRTFLNDEEQRAILEAVQNMQILMGEKSNLWLKLSTLFQKEAEPWLKVDFSRWGYHADMDTEKFDLIKRAILCKRVLKIIYCSNKGESQERDICPLQLVYKSRDWYLYALCQLRNDYRLFKMSRILKTTEKEAYFNETVFHTWEEKKEEIPEEAMIHLHLKFEKSVGFRIYDEFPIETIEKNEEGDFIVKIDMPMNEWIYAYLLSFGEKVKILEPESLKDEIIKMIKRMADTI